MTGRNKHKAWCDSHILDVHLPCTCKRGLFDTEIRRAERERCATLADVLATSACFEYGSLIAQEVAEDMARRIARELRLMED